MSRQDRPAALRGIDAGMRLALRLGFKLLQGWWWLTHPTIQGVYVAVRHGEDVLLIRNSYRSAYSFPSGRRGRREDPAAAAARELREEVGIDVAPDALRLCAEVRLATRLVDDHVHVYELHLDAPPEVRIDHREVVWARFEACTSASERPLLPLARRYLEGTLGEISVAPVRER